MLDEFSLKCRLAGAAEVSVELPNFRNAEFLEAFCFCSQKLNETVNRVSEMRRGRNDCT